MEAELLMPVMMMMMLILMQTFRGDLIVAMLQTVASLDYTWSL